MKMKIASLIATIAIHSISYGQASQIKNELVDLAKVYRNFHFSNNPPDDVFNQLNSVATPELTTAKEFISELIKTDNKIATKKYLTKPDSATLKNLFIVRSLNWAMYDANPTDYNSVIDSIANGNIDYNELLACYYGMLFSAIGNKNQPFDMEEVNFTLWDYNLLDDTEKGIFFLMSMETFGTLIWGYMNIPKPPNYKEALRYINNYPKYNGQPYYQFLDLNFKDFNLTIDKRSPKGSFKKYYINKYMNTLLYHCLSLSQKKKDDQKRTDVLLGSILKNESYWDYFSNREILQKIFTKIKE